MSIKCLFIPVSSPQGIGEYMRSLTLAQTLYQRDNSASIAFVLSEAAPYVNDCPFPVYLCPSSATHHSALVKRHMDDFGPDIVIFDAAGRAAQLRYAKQLGAQTIFICQHKKKLAKALGLRRLRYTDALWWAQPQAMLHNLSFWIKCKLSILAKEKLTCIGPIFHSPNHSTVASTLIKYGLNETPFVFVNAGSGGHSVNGRNAADIFASVGQRIAEACNTRVVIIYGPNYQSANPQTGLKEFKVDDDRCLHIPSVSQVVFSALLKSAETAILSGGSTLFQSIAFGTRTVCAAVAKDQQGRIDALSKDNAIFPSSPDEDALFKAYQQARNIDPHQSAKKNTENTTNTAIDHLFKLWQR